MTNPSYRWYTFEHIDRPTVNTHEWTTLRFGSDGSVALKTRDKVRATRTVWEPIGSWWRSRLFAGGVHVDLSEDSFATRLACTAMTRLLPCVVATVQGALPPRREFGRVAILECRRNGAVSKPTTLRAGHETRRTSLNLGLRPATGRRHGNHASNRPLTGD